MAHLISLSIDATKITKSRIKNGKYVNLTINIADETDQYGNSISCWESQSKEERESKAKRNYLGNGRVLFTDGTVHKTEAAGSEKHESNEPTNEMPF